MSEQIKKILLIVVMLLSYFPIFFTLTVEMPAAFHISKTAAYIGFVTMWWAYVLGIRRLSGLFIKDLRWIMFIHKWFNIICLLIVLIHPISLVLGVYGIELLIPRISTNFSNGIVNYTNGVTSAIIATIVLAIVWVTSALLKDRMAFRPWKFIHLATYPLFVLLYYHIQIGFLQRLVPALGIYNTTLFILYVVLVSWQLLSRLGIGIKKFDLERVTQRAKGVVTLTLKSREPNFTAEIGQYVYIQLNKAGESHPFSVSGYARSTNTLEVTVKDLGSFSNSIQSLQPGQEIFLDGPYGTFLTEVWDSNRPIVMLAGGIGVTPFISLLSQMPNLSELHDRSIYLIYGCKTRQDMAFKPELDQLQQQFPKLHVIFVLDSDPEYEGEKGFITADLINRNVYDELVECEFFVCGPPVMIKKMQSMLAYIGIAKQQVHIELFG